MPSVRTNDTASLQPLQSPLMRTVADLTPNTVDLNNPRSQSSWFYFIRRSSRQHQGTVAPIKKTEFVRAWNSMDQNFRLTCFGETLHDCKDYLIKLNTLPILPRLPLITECAWVRIILALNMYAEVRKNLNIFPNEKIDFIGSASVSNNYCNRLEYRFHNRRILYIDDTLLIDLIRLVANNSYFHFWECIFDIYDNLYHPLSSQRQRCHSIYNSANIPNHPITNENEEENINLSNQQIANMILRTRNILPYNLRKTIYETCIAFHISCTIN